MTCSGASSCIQCPGPSRRSYRQGPPDVLGRIGHLGLCAGDVSRAPDSHRGSLHRRDLRLARPPATSAAGPETSSGPGVSDELRAQLAIAWSASGCPIHSGERTWYQLSWLSHCSPMPSNWFSSTYQELLALLLRAAVGSRKANRQCDQVVDRGRCGASQRPRQRRAPIMSYDMGPPGPSVRHDGEHILDQQLERVRVDGLGLVRAPVAAQVRHDDPESGRRQRRYLVPPDPPRIRKAVQQHNRRSLSRHVVLDTDPVDLDPAHRVPPFPSPEALLRS